MAAAAAERLGESDREFAFAAEVGDRLAQFLDAGEASLIVADLDEQADNARVVGRLPEQLDGVDEVARTAEQAAGQQIGGGGLGRYVAQVERQYHRARQRLGRERAGEDQGCSAGHKEQRQHADSREEADDISSHGFVSGRSSRISPDSAEMSAQRQASPTLSRRAHCRGPGWRRACRGSGAGCRRDAIVKAAGRWP